MEDAKSLLQEIVAATEERDFSDPNGCVVLPFPSLKRVPDRFKLAQVAEGTFRYMGRTGYARVRRTVLGLRPEDARGNFWGGLPVRPDQLPGHPYQKAALWGTMGSGKSFILAALACDLLASFSRSSEGKAFQRQRVVYLPDCETVLHPRDRIEAFRASLCLSYAGDDVTLERIAMLSDEGSLEKFFDEETQRGVVIYLIVDQDNALDPSEGDNAEIASMKFSARLLIDGLALRHLIVKGASANNRNARKWQSKQLNIAKVFHHGGLDDEEYKCWKKHFGTYQAVTSSGGAATDAVTKQTPLGQLTEGQELRVKDATGRVPLFLQCWSGFSDDTPNALERSWGRFIEMPEIIAAGSHLKDFIEGQFNAAVHWKSRLQMYIGFITQGELREIPEHFDCRYLYIETDGTGRYVCGVYRDLIAEVLQKLQRPCFLQSEWKQAISREAGKENPNCALLGFMVEQEMLAQIWQSGIPLYAETTIKCDDIVYFTSGSEKHLQIKEGCMLYVPCTFNYHRVDAVLRWWKSPSGCDAPPPEPEKLVDFYSKLSLHVAGVQISLGSLPDHLNSEREFCSPEAMKVWYPGWDSKNVARWFVWYIWQSEIDRHTREAVEMSPCLYANRQVKRKTRAAKVQELDHVTVFLSVEQFEPCLKKMKEM